MKAILLGKGTVGEVRLGEAATLKIGGHVVADAPDMGLGHVVADAPDMGLGHVVADAPDMGLGHVVAEQNH